MIVTLVLITGRSAREPERADGIEPILRVIGGLPPGAPAGFEAALGWGWLVELLEDYGFEPHLVHPLQCKAIASARLKNGKVDAAILGQVLRADLPRCALKGSAEISRCMGMADRMAGSHRHPTTIRAIEHTG